MGHGSHNNAKVPEVYGESAQNHQTFQFGDVFSTRGERVLAGATLRHVGLFPLDFRGETVLLSDSQVQTSSHIICSAYIQVDGRIIG